MTVAGAVVLATLALVGSAWLRLPSVDPRARLLAADDPTAEIDRQVTAEFGMVRPVAWVIVPREGTVWTTAVLARVRGLTRDALTIPGVVAADVVSLASPNVRDLRAGEDTLEPTYLMSEVPTTAEALAAVRQRVEANPQFNGTLVSLDGRAALVVADFRPAADGNAIAAAATTLRDRYRDAEVDVAVTGQPLLAAALPALAPPLAAAAAAVVLAGLLALALSSGVADALAVSLAVGLALLWASAGAILLHIAVLPWAAFALLPTALLAALFTAGAVASWPACGVVAASLAVGGLGAAIAAGDPSAPFGAVVALGALVALAAARTARCLLPASWPPAPLRLGGLRPLSLALVFGAIAGIGRLHATFTDAGVGLRYLPPAASADLRLLARHFPPPPALAVRLRGPSGFVGAPAVLEAIDGVTTAARADPAVARALSLADLVKLVNQAFHGGDPAFLTIPDEPGMAGRYLALAYSPGFRHFVDRGFSRTAIWVYLSSDRVDDLARVRGILAAHLAAHPIPNATVDPIVGDGALALGAARSVRALALAIGAALAAAAVLIGATRGPSAGLRALAGGGCAGAVALGLLGWLGVPIDLVSAPLVLLAVIGGGASAVVGGCRGGAAALTAMAAAAFVASVAGGTLLGTAFGTALLALVIAGVVVGPVEER